MCLDTYIHAPLTCFSNSQEKKTGRHKKSVKIGLSLFLVFILSFTPSLWATFIGKISGYFGYTFVINNLANFFIYMVVDEDFRGKLKAMCKRSRE